MRHTMGMDDYYMNDIPTKYCATFDEVKNEGDFCYSKNKDYMFIVLPFAGLVGLNLEKPHNPRWKLSGNPTKPTLQPSINSPEWHGWLTEGVLSKV